MHTVILARCTFNVIRRKLKFYEESADEKK